MYLTFTYENLLIDRIEPDVYEQALNLYNEGFHITILRKNSKVPLMKNWNKLPDKPSVDMTGVGIVTGTQINNGNFVYALDIDIYRPYRREEIFQKILQYIIRPVYIETTCSGGYRIFFYCENNIISKAFQFDFSEENDCARHKDNVELFAGMKQVLVSPSKAINKKGETGKYSQISETGLLESAILSKYDVEKLINYLDQLSYEYSKEKFQHRYKTSSGHRKELRTVYQSLTSQGYIAGPLVNGERHCRIENWKNGVDNAAFEVENLTGIVLKLGKQPDGMYLSCFDIDKIKNKKGYLPFEILDQFKPVLGDSFYSEMSVSQGYHIIVKSKDPLDLNKKWKLPDGSILEVLCSDHDTVNVAPTTSFINKYEFSGYPEYQKSIALSSIENITLVDTETVRNFINNLQPYRKSQSFNKVAYNLASAENQAVISYMQKYDKLSAINRQIKAVFPDVIDLLNFLDMAHSNKKKPQYINFFSLYADDGNNPDAILFYNNNNDPENVWSGYSVQDFHSSEVISFGQYLCKHSQDRFDKLMEKIGYRATSDSIPVSTEFHRKPVTFKCQRYITEDLRIQIFEQINQVIKQNPGKQCKIVLSAPTGIGKTEMFYQLAIQKEIRMILALSYTSQVLQGKAQHTIPGVLGGMCEKDFEVPKGSIFMTYDKSAILINKIKPSKYIMIIDEAHNLVNHSDFRENVLLDLKNLTDRCKAVIYMTATPEYVNYYDVDLMIKIELENPPLKDAYVCKYGKDVKNVAADVAINQHIPGQIDVIYTRSIKQLEQIQKRLQQKSLEVHLLYSDLKNDSKVYQSLSNHSVLSGKGLFSRGGVLLTTNLIVDGINIMDENIGNIFVLNPMSTTDLIQFPARFRNGYKNYFIFVSGNTPRYVHTDTRLELVRKFYNLALKQQESYNFFKYHLYNCSIPSGMVEEILLTKRYTFLDKFGRISENILLKKVQDAEARQMNYDESAIHSYMTNGYNFNITEITPTSLIERRLTSQEKEKADIELLIEKKDAMRAILTILIKDEYFYKRQDLIKDYLKRKHHQFLSLSKRFNISKHKYTGRFKELLKNRECLKILYRYCTGLELNAVSPYELIYWDKYSKNTVFSIRRTYNNLMLEKSGANPKGDDKYYRFVELRRWIRRMKQGKSVVTVTSKDLSDFTTYFNSKYAVVYKVGDIRSVVEDLNDIFAVKTEIIRNNEKKDRHYQVEEEWSLNNIQGISFLPNY